MKIYDKNDNPIKNPDLTLGYLTPDKRLIAHHEAVEAVAEVWHHEVTKVYPNGGKEVKRVIDVPATPAKDAWDEFEDIQRYIEYTTDQMAAMARAKRDAMLDETDKFAVLDAPISKECWAELRVYRQALRDIPEQPGFPQSIDWPKLPAITKAAPDPVDVAFDTLVGGDTYA